MEPLLLQRGAFEQPLHEHTSLDLADTKDGANDFQIDVPSLSSKEPNDQIDALILAWVLLLYRGTLEQGAEELDWGFASFATGDAPVHKVSASVSDVSLSDADQISEKLEAIRKIHGSETAAVNDFILAAVSKADVNLN